MKVTMIRHTSVDVPKGMCYGWSDVPVAPTFEQEATETKKSLEGKSFDCVFSSPLTRAKKLAAFCVGGSPIENPDIDQFLKNNFSEDEQKKVKIFYCPGGFNYDKMSKPSKMMMKMFIKALKARKDKTEEDEIMIKMISQSYDISDVKYADPIVEYLKEDK